MALLQALLLLYLTTAVSSFAPPTRHTASLRSALRATTTSAAADVIVISPPGGIGEITVLESAKNGNAVKWFVVSSSSSDNTNNNLSLDAAALHVIQKAGGSLELAGADCTSLLYEESGAAKAVMEWCSAGKVLLCTYDGADEEGRRSFVMNGNAEDSNGGGGVEEKAMAIKRGIRVAAREAASASVNAVKVIALDSEEEMMLEGNEEKKGGGGGLLDGLNLFKNNKKNVPDTLAEALNGQVSIVRYGELFGAAESSVSNSYYCSVLY